MARKRKSARSSPRPQALFDRVGARGWRGSGHFTFSATFAALRDWFVAQLPARSCKILSVGCGGGELEMRLMQAGHRVVGFDLSYPMLAAAVRRGLGWAVQGDGQMLPFRAACFDAVLICETLGYLDVGRVLGEAHRVLKRNGRVMITTYAAPVSVHRGYRKYRFNDIAPPVTASGFRLADHGFLRVTARTATAVPREQDSHLLYVIVAKMSAPKRG